MDLVRAAWFFIALVGILCTLNSCAFKRVVPEGEYRYMGADISIETEASSKVKKQLRADLEDNLAPLPNRKILGIPWRLALYNAFYNKKKGKVWAFKKAARPPVLLKSEVSRSVAEVLESTAFNDGFFNTQVSYDIKRKERLRRAHVNYKVMSNDLYEIGGLQYAISDSSTARILNAEREKAVVETGTPYQLEALRTEQNRLTVAMKKAGFYYFEPSFLNFRADTSSTEDVVDLRLTLTDKATPQTLMPYRLGKIRVVSDYDVRDQKGGAVKDTIDYQGVAFIQREENVKPKTIIQAITLKTGEFYDPKAHETTLKRLSNLNSYKFVSIRFERLPNQDSLLDVRILLTPKIKRTIEAELGGSYKAGLYLTPEATVSYTNRNLFGGAEVLRINGRGAFNFPQNDTLTYFNEYTLEASIQKPNLWTPFPLLKFNDKTVGSTRFGLSLDREGYRLRFPGSADLIRADFPDLAILLDEDPDLTPSYELLEIEAKYGFTWQQRSALKHTLNPFVFGYQRSTFNKNDEQLNDLILVLALLSSVPQISLSLEDMLYYKAEYILNYDSRQKKFKTHNYLLRNRLAFATNRLINRNENIVLPRDAFQSSYFILEPDFRYLGAYGKKNQLALRIAPSVTLPLNEEVFLPFFDLYSIGGPNSNRAFVPRTIGPGARPQNQPLQFPFSGLGNIKLELNAEYRYQISTLFEMAAFVDAGNVWQIYQDPDPFETQFELDRFYRQLAIGAGLGIRLDFEILLLRFDFGLPIMKPYLPEGERFVGDEIDLLSQSYRQNNLQFNFAFGYPF